MAITPVVVSGMDRDMLFGERAVHSQLRRKRERLLAGLPLGESIDPAAPRFLDGGRMYGSPLSLQGVPGKTSVSLEHMPSRATCPAPPADEKPCPEPPEKALLQTALAQQKMLMDQSTPSSTSTPNSHEAQQDASDFELAINTCNRIRDLKVLLQLLVGQGPQNIKDFNKYFGLVKNILQGTRPL